MPDERETLLQEQMDRFAFCQGVNMLIAGYMSHTKTSLEDTVDTLKMIVSDYEEALQKPAKNVQ